MRGLLVPVVATAVPVVTGCTSARILGVEVGRVLDHLIEESQQRSVSGDPLLNGVITASRETGSVCVSRSCSGERHAAVGWGLLPVGIPPGTGSGGA